MSVDPTPIVAQRRSRLDQTMDELGVGALLTSDPFSVRYATGTRNMLVHGMTGPDRFALVFAGGPAIVWEFAGCEHLTRDAPFVDELRIAPGLTMKKTPNFSEHIAAFASEVAAECTLRLGQGEPLAIEGMNPPTAAALCQEGLALADGVAVTQTAMTIKQPAEVTAMRAAVAMTERAALDMRDAIVPGATEQQVWAEFHRSLVAEGGELVVTRLLQAGERTFPYFQEASANALRSGDLVCFDSDAVGLGGYSVDFSRTFLCGDEGPSAIQRELFGLAEEQLAHNAANLRPGSSFADFARAAFDVPEPYARYGYYQLAHGLGMLGGHPNIPRASEEPYPLPGAFEPGMVICVESYVGDPDSRQGVKLENQYLILDDGVEQMSTFPLDQRLSAAR